MTKIDGVKICFDYLLLCKRVLQSAGIVPSQDSPAALSAAFMQLKNLLEAGSLM